jgi:hypothetical protein
LVNQEKQTQFKPNTKPIQTQSKPKQTQYKAKQTQFQSQYNAALLWEMSVKDYT